MKSQIASRFLLPILLGAHLLSGTTFPVILNEFNAVREGRWLDADGLNASTASDAFFVRVVSNGGDWFELVVVGDGTSGSTVDMQGWRIGIEDTDEGSSAVVLNNHPYWAAVPAGTILTFTAKNTSEGGLDTSIDREDLRDSEGWASSNFYIGDAVYINLGLTSTSLTVANDDTQITISDSIGNIVFGPAGEGISPSDGVNSREVFTLQASPSPLISPNSSGYTDSTNSTFGSPNPLGDGTSLQSFLAFRTLGPAPIFSTTQDDTNLLAGQTFSLPLNASDANGGTLALSAPSLPGWLSLTDNGDGTGLLEGIPTPADAGPNAVVVEVSDTPFDGTDTISFSIQVFPFPSPIILNEYNADNSWLELVVVGDGTPGSTVDLRGWSIQMEDDDGSSEITLSTDPFWEEVQVGTILLFSANNAGAGGFDTNPSVQDFLENAGWASAQFWIGDTTYLDSSGTTGSLNVSNADAKVSVFDGSANQVFGPAGEGIFSNGGVNSAERFALQDDPSPLVSPFGANYTDSNESSPGQPNATATGFQIFEAFATGTPNSAPIFTWQPTNRLDFMTVATTGFDEYLAFITVDDPNPGDSLTVSILSGPSWLRVENFDVNEDDLIGDPEPGDEGIYEVTLQVSDGNLASTLTFTLYVFHETSPVLVNEFNAVAPNNLLNNGSSFDPFWGPVEGNGGDWIELVVVGDGTAESTVDMRGWRIEITDDGGTPESIVLSQHSYWSSVRAGTILTFTETSFDQGGLDTGIHRINRFDDLSPEGGWAWTNILVTDPTFVDQAASDFGTGFPISNNDTRISLFDALDDLIFGPIGEEFISSGVSATEVFKLEQDPSPSANPLDGAYNDGSSSTFGAPNIWSAGSTTQDFSSYASSSPVNSIPYFTFVSPLWARQGETFSQTISAEDFDASASLSLTLTSGPSWLSLTDQGGGLGLLEGIPTSGDLGFQTVTVAVSDGTDVAIKTFSLYVHPATATVILNEYNAVSSGSFLNGGDSAADEDGGTASDPVFGRVSGNGGDWFELVVVGNGAPGSVDLRGWQIEIADQASFPFVPRDTIVLSQDSRLAAVPNGTILTFTEKRSSEGGLDTAWEAIDNLDTEGWIWSNIWIGDSALIDYTDQAFNGYEIDSGTGEVSGIAISNDDTWFLIRDSFGTPVYGPVGEGIAPLSGISSTEVFELEGDPRPTVSPLVAADDGPPVVLGYDDGSTSTFGRPNEWNGGLDVQDFSPFIPSSGPSPLEVFLTSFGLSGPNLLATADSDGDDANQLVEFAFGSNPASGASRPDLLAGRAADPSTGDDHFTITFLRRVGGTSVGASYSVDGITYTVQGSTNLIDWTAPVEPTVNPPGLPLAPSGYEWVTFRHVSPTTSGEAFLRVLITQI
ncbi:MAG: hypothetical protein ACFCU4_03695 [Puniceicoccaceae bacterium]